MPGTRASAWPNPRCPRLEHLKPRRACILHPVHPLETLLPEISPITRLRIQQIRLVSKILIKLKQYPAVKFLLYLTGRSPALDRLLVGFRTTFPSFQAANQYAARYKLPSHEHPANIANHLSLNLVARPSDTPVIEHLRAIGADLKSVLDIGGSAGNLFYCYDDVLHFPPDLQWTVFEVPQTVVTGRQIAQERNEPRLRFIDDLSACTTADTVIISGALHYFEELPAALIRFLDPPPKHIFINRTPVIQGLTVVTIQDASQYYAISPARILSRGLLIPHMDRANYELVDQWRVDELKLHIPLHPEASAPSYSGFYFRARPK